jgi:hypothetical protein
MPDDEPAPPASRHPRLDTGELRFPARIPQPEGDVDDIVILIPGPPELRDLAHHAPERILGRSPALNDPPVMMAMTTSCRIARTRLAIRSRSLGAADS